MTPEEQMKDIAIAAGGKWEVKEWISTDVQGGSGDGYYDDRTYLNPSPTDMNALMEYAEKLGLVYHFKRLPEGLYYAGVFDQKGKLHFVDRQENRADVFREALYQAVKGKG